MKKIILYSIAVILLSSCLRLDSNLFNPKKIIEYKLDKFEDVISFGSKFDIDPKYVELFTLQSDPKGENVKIYALYIGDQSRIGQDTVILYNHGNYAHMDYYWQRAKLLANVGAKNRYGVMMIDYRGFGLSEGTPTEQGLYKDVEAALNWLKSKGLTEQRLVTYGFSLGSAPTTQLNAFDSPIKSSKIILEAPFASSEVFVKSAASISLPASYFVNLKIQNAENIKKINVPFLWLHGKEDDFISIQHGEIIFNNYNGTYKEAHRIEKAEHGNIPYVLTAEEYIDILNKFIVK